MRSAKNKTPYVIYKLSREKAINRAYWTGNPGDDLSTASHPSCGEDSNEPLPRSMNLQLVQMHPITTSSQMPQLNEGPGCLLQLMSEPKARVKISCFGMFSKKC
jgi:hypothetical protein